MTTNLNVACAMRDCVNPVIGQCRSCGRYYCANHNIGALCSDCGREKVEKEKYLDFLQTAETVKRETDKNYSFNKSAYGMGIGTAIFFLVVGLVCTLTGIGGMDITMLSCVGTLSLLAIASLILAQRFESSSRRKRALKKAAQINMSKLGFLHFYEVYDPEISFQDEIKEMFTTGGKFALSITGLVAGSIAHDEKEAIKRAQLENLVSNAVDDELKRHGL